jgi:hypothetical protein
VVTYTGDASDQVVSHSLGSTPGCIIIKPTSGTGDWIVYHRGLTNNGANHSIKLNTTAAQVNQGGLVATDSTFTLYHTATVNTNNVTYVAYLFAHNDGDGGFGPNGDQDIIKCGSYSGNGNGEYDDNGTEVNLGFEPQWVLIKSKTWYNGNWMIVDTMRGITVKPTPSSRDGDDAVLYANRTYAEEGASSFLRVTPTGFKLETDNYDINGSPHDYIYIAIRRGLQGIPEDATDVFAIDTYGGTSPTPPTFNSGFPVDMAFYKDSTGSDGWQNQARPIQGRNLVLDIANAAGSSSAANFDYSEGYFDDTYVGSSIYGYMWRRATSYFDIVNYFGDGVAGRTVSHNLGAAPGMMWVKKTSQNSNWEVYLHSEGGTKRIYLDVSNAIETTSSAWNNTDATDTEFTLGTSSQTNQNGGTFIAYLFGTAPGVSKVGSYTGNGSSGRVIDCGFSSGARFILIKGIDVATDWYVWDTARGIVSGNDGYLLLNTSSSQNTNTDTVDPNSSGFSISDSIAVNGSGYNYMFYAIA